MMKKLMCFLLVLSLAMALAGCGSKDGNTQGGRPPPQSQMKTE